MAAIDELLQESENLRDSIAKALLQAIPDIEQKIYDKVLKLLDEYDSTNGYFISQNTSAAKLLKINDEIIKILSDSGYFKAANTYIGDLKKITANTEMLHKAINKIDIVKASMNGIEKVYAENAVQLLKASGLSKNFIEPVTTVVNEAITFGYSIQNSRDTLAAYVKGTPTKYGKLESYLTVTARDTISQMQGAQHQKVQIDWEMPYILYTGGKLKDSAGQCVRWADMRYIPVEDLEKEIALALANQAAGLVQPKGHKWAGFNKATNPENFCIYRGHPGCIHSAFPVREKYE